MPNETYNLELNFQTTYSYMYLHINMTNMRGCIVVIILSVEFLFDVYIIFVYGINVNIPSSFTVYVYLNIHRQNCEFNNTIGIYLNYKLPRKFKTLVVIQLFQPCLLLEHICNSYFISYNLTIVANFLVSRFIYHFIFYS